MIDILNRNENMEHYDNIKLEALYKMSFMITFFSFLTLQQFSSSSFLYRARYRGKGGMILSGGTKI